MQIEMMGVLCEFHKNRRCCRAPKGIETNVVGLLWDVKKWRNKDTF